MPFRELRFPSIPSETECGSEGHPDSHPEADIIQRYPNADTESETDANTLLNSLSFCF